MDASIVQKMLMSLPKRFESKIYSLEDSKDLTKITLGELVTTLQAQEQRRLMRQEEAVADALLVKHTEKSQQKKKEQESSKAKVAGSNSLW